MTESPKVSVFQKIWWFIEKEWTRYKDKRAGRKLAAAAEKALQEEKRRSEAEAAAAAQRIADTKEAERTLRTARLFLNEVYDHIDHYDNGNAANSKAAAIIADARRLDPNASVTIDNTTITCDTLTGECLYAEALIKFLATRSSKPDQIDKYNMQNYIRPALPVIDRAITYLPNRPAFHRLKAQLLWRAGQKSEALTAIQKAYDLSPDEEETLKVMGTIR